MPIKEPAGRVERISCAEPVEAAGRDFVRGSERQRASRGSSRGRMAPMAMFGGS